MQDKTFILAFFKRLKKPALNVLFMFLAWAATFILSVIAKLFFGEASDSIMNYNPIIYSRRPFPFGNEFRTNIRVSDS
jgi:hypothetical protein